MATPKYQGLPPKLKDAVFTRDNWRCRWCGITNAYGYDIHHIQYRRGYSYDVIENLVTLDRKCHDMVHDSYVIPKAKAQEILSRLISTEGSGMTGLAVMRVMSAEQEPQIGIRHDRVVGPVGRLLSKEEPNDLGSTTG